MNNLDQITRACHIVHNNDRDHAIAVARHMLADWDPNEPDCYDDVSMPAMVFVVLTAFVNDPGDITHRAAIKALECFYEMG